jgi:hypothetical protein
VPLRLSRAVGGVRHAAREARVGSSVRVVILQGIESLPSDVIKGLRALLLIAERLDEIAVSTSEVPMMRPGIDALGADTRRLPGVEAALERLAGAMADMSDELGRVVGATDVLPTMDGRMAQIEASMPVLVEVQQHLSRLPETIETLGEGIDRMAALMDRLLSSIDALDANVGAVRSSLEPIGRIVDRVPGNRRAS